MPKPARDFDRRAPPLRLGCGLRSRGSSPESSVLGLADFLVDFVADFLGLSSAIEMRSCGPSRRSLSAAASPNCGSLPPPVFFRPHAIHERAHHSMRHTSERDLKPR